MNPTESNQALRLKKIGEKVRELRKRNPLYINYEAFAFLNKISKNTLHRIESGGNYNIESLFNVLDKLNISPSEFFVGID